MQLLERRPEKILASMRFELVSNKSYILTTAATGC